MIKIVGLLCVLASSVFATQTSATESLSGDSSSFYYQLIVPSAPVYTGPRVVVTLDTGGDLFDYIKKYNDFREGNTYIRIADLCLSACTVITGVVSDDHVCVSPSALFGFHSATEGLTFSKEGTDLMWNILPKRVQDLVRAAGWDGHTEHQDLVYVKGLDLYQRCPGGN